jgi:hypothetical protein
MKSTPAIFHAHWRCLSLQACEQLAVEKCALQVAAAAFVSVFFETLSHNVLAVI